MRGLLGIGVLLVATLMVVGALVWSGAGEDEVSALTGPDFEAVAQGGVEKPRGEESSTLDAPVAPDVQLSERSEVASDDVPPWVRIVDQEGAPISGAEISWIPLAEYLPAMAKGFYDWRALHSTTHFALTGEDGRAELPVVSHTEIGALWVSAPSYSIRGQLFGGSLAMGMPLASIALRKEDAARVSVTGQGDVGAEGDLVIWQRLAPDSKLLGVEKQLEALFIRTRTLESYGTVEFSIKDRPFRYQAFAPRQMSNMGKLVGSGEVTLAMGGSTEIACQVDGVLPELSSATITIYYQDLAGDLFAQAAFRPVDRGGVVTAQVRHFAEGRYRVCLDGSGVETREVICTELVPNERRLVQFEAAAGHVFGVKVSDSGGAPIEGVSARPDWDDIDGFRGYGVARGVTDSTGAAQVGNLPATPFYLGVTPPDFEPQSLGPYLAANLAGEVLEITLAKPAQLRGTVTFQGTPVENFHIVCWEGGSWNGWQSVDFVDAEDGAFVIDSAPLGEVSVVASADGFGQSRVVLATVIEGEGGEVELELAEALIGQGIVLDDDTGEPVVGAEIVQWTLMATFPLEDSDNVVRTGADGSFELEGFAPGAAYATVEADGYVRSAMTADGAAPAGPDFGTIRLMPAKPLTVQFLKSGVTDWTGYLVEAHGVGLLPSQALASNGVAILPAAKRGEYNFTLTAPDGAKLWERFMVWGPGPWHKEVQLQASIMYQVRLTGLSESIASVAGVEVYESRAFREASGTVRSLPLGTAQFDVEALGPGPHIVLVSDKDGRVLNRTLVPAGTASGSVVAIDLEAVVDVTLRVVDAGGTPMPGLSIFARSKVNPAAFIASATTDSEGLAKLYRLDDWSCELSLRDEKRVGMFGIPATFPKEGSPLEIVWEATTDLVLDVRDNGTPLEGLDVWIHTPNGVSSIDLMNVTKDGKAIHQGLAPGEYMVQPGGNWVWPQDITVHVTEAGFEPSAIEFRRRGDLTLTVVNELGKPVAGAAVSMYHKGLGEDVADWIADGRVLAQSGLVTNANGQVVLTGLPRGQVACQVQGAVPIAIKVPAQAEGTGTIVAGL